MGSIIFVTPISPSWIKRIRKMDFGKYERLICQRVGFAGLRVIRGAEFRWEGKITPSRTILWDGIHSTELGYRLYAENVIRYLKYMRC